jgi:hypothetical protein
MNKTAQSVWKTVCLLLKTTFKIKPTRFEPIKSVELTDNIFKFLVNFFMNG